MPVAAGTCLPRGLLLRRSTARRRESSRAVRATPCFRESSRAVPAPRRRMRVLVTRAGAGAVGLVVWVRGGEWREGDWPRGYGLEAGGTGDGDAGEDDACGRLERLLLAPWSGEGDVTGRVNVSRVIRSRDLR